MTKSPPPTKVLVAAGGVIAASTAVLPTITGYGTILFQVIALGAWRIIAAITSDLYADTHHLVVWCVALAVNVLLFLVPAVAVWLISKKRWPIACSFVILGWALFYVASLFWFFPEPDGP